MWWRHIDKILVFATAGIGIAIFVVLIVRDRRADRRFAARQRQFEELQRHEALPPAYTDDTARLAPYGAQPRPENEIAGRGRREVPCRRRADPLPDDLSHGRDRLRVIARRRPKQ